MYAKGVTIVTSFAYISVLGISGAVVVSSAETRRPTQASSPADQTAAPAPQFSRPGGFYTEPFELQLSVTNRNAEIRFTLDGTEPTAASPRYRKPLPLVSRKGTRNALSSIPTVAGGPIAGEEVFKGWVVRARAFQTGTSTSEIATATFWIDARGRARYSLPVISLVTDAAHFFDPQTGIYVPGRAANGNYMQKGPQWVRPVHVELYETNNTCAFSQDARIKIHGNTSQMWPLKGLDLQAADSFSYRLFPDRQRIAFKHFLLRPSGQDQQVAFLRDELTESLAAEAGIETQAARPCVVFIDGEYWGLNYLKEKEDVQFVSAIAGRPKRELDYIGDQGAPKAGSAQAYWALLEYVRRNNLGKAECYAQVAEAMDLANFISYRVCEIFSYRWDINQPRLWRPQTPHGRWRWLSFDGDVAWGGFWSESPAWQFNMLAAELSTDGSLHGHNTEESTLLLRRLTTCPQFRRDFVNRFQDLLNTTFLPSNTLARIEQLSSTLAPEMEEHIRRWRAPGSVAEWRNNIDQLRNFARRRPAFAREQLRQQFHLQPSCRVVVNVSPPGGGTVRVNTLSLPVGQADDASGTNAWSGLYFKQHPISLEARAAASFRFDGWLGATNSVSTSLEFAPEKDCAVTARFVRVPEPR
jgi:hypothetical protein